MAFSESDLILPDGNKVYHLNISPDDIADFIITVGDPDRVNLISGMLDKIEVEAGKREFKLVTGYIGSRRLSILSTGIGPDNIDIVMNEIDFLFNVDLDSRMPKNVRKSLNIIRLGTSGGLQPQFEPGCVVLSEMAFGLDSLLHFYQYTETEPELMQAFKEQCKLPVEPYSARGSSQLLDALSTPGWHPGITVTNVGFYGPQGRNIIIPPRQNFVDLFEKFSFRGHSIANLEMETSAIYGLSSLLGHRALSVNVIIANRPLNLFHPEPRKPVVAAAEHLFEIIGSGII